MLPFGWWVVFGWFLFVVLVGIGLTFWAWRHGFFKDIEEPKYRMLEDKEPEPWPDSKKTKKKLSEV